MCRYGYDVKIWGVAASMEGGGKALMGRGGRGGGGQGWGEGGKWR